MMRCVSTRKLAALTAGLLTLAVTSGCASLSSVKLPWKKAKSSSSDESAKEGEVTATPRQCGSTGATTRFERIEDAKYWARKAVSASHQLAHAQGVRLATENANVAVRSKTPSTRTGSGGHADGGARSGEAASDKKIVRSESKANPDEESQTTTISAKSPDYRTVSREQTTTEADRASGWPLGLPGATVTSNGAYTPVDPTVDVNVFDLTDAAQRQKVEQKFGVSPPSSESAVAIPGTFLDPDQFSEFDDLEELDNEERNKQVAIVRPGEKIEVYAGSEEIASLQLSKDLGLPGPLTDIRPVQVIEDGTTQLVAYWAETTEDSEKIRYKAGLLKVIGPFVGKIFEETVATKATPSAEMQRRGYFEFLSGQKNCFIRWTPADGDGDPKAADADVLKWNRWSGVYRLPKPPPTAPDNRS